VQPQPQPQGPRPPVAARPAPPQQHAPQQVRPVASATPSARRTEPVVYIVWALTGVLVLAFAVVIVIALSR
jgi:hypothetical protein